MVVVGAGPVGLWLAAELRLRDVSVLVLEKAAVRDSRSRAVGMQAGTLDTFATRGVAERFIERGTPVPPVLAGAQSVRHRATAGRARHVDGGRGASRAGAGLADTGRRRRRTHRPFRRPARHTAHQLGGGMRRNP
ncbi:FAD-dependent monooxygenase [Streptomyces sp. 205]|uniref:FAD-dependent monooxygenase n=1 Tax=Streptomyces coffeae TaxID=621382 RepID=A0ABS1NEA5_9ACTN|nr:FAD-dependent monooxygenase [Streptomyces coffeae]